MEGRIRCVGKEWDDVVDGKKKKISIGEELVDNVLTKGVEDIPQLFGYSTEQSVFVMGHRIPREGLLAVYYDEYMVSSMYHSDKFIDIDCFYENGDWLSFTTNLPGKKEGSSEAFEKAIRRFDENIPIYHHLYWNCPTIMLSFPYQKYISQQPTVNKKAIEELPRIYQDNHFWKVSCKSRARWDGKYEMELSINGTGITWILYLILLACMVIAFFSFSILGYIGWFAGALCYYFAFYRSAHRLAVRAVRSLNCVLQKKKICDSSDH
ncbi:MAG: hypothetical protein PUE95_13740 [Lachnospiraceae bacterium]|nr:hypothetical protein [Lachnospiraceae bacterium]